MTQKIKTEVYSRVVGYLKPLSRFNPGKISERKQRNYFSASDIESIGA